MASKSVGQRGKYAEGVMKAYLGKVNSELLAFDFLRLPDPRTAGGRGTSMPADFEFFYPSGHGLLEVKEIKSPRLLPAANVSQLPSMRKRTIAGGDCYIVVYHTTTKKWRRIPVMDLELKTTGSWDLSDYEQYDTLAEALPKDLLGGLSG